MTYKTRLRVSDHAVVRYLERVRGVDIGAIHAEIARNADAAAAAGASAALTGGFRYVLDNDTVVTVHPVNAPCPRTGRVRDKRRARDD